MSSDAEASVTGRPAPANAGAAGDRAATTIGGAALTADPQAPRALAGVLRDRLGPDAVVEDPDVLAGYRHDHAPMAAAGHAGLAVRARSAAGVAATVEAAAAHGVPVVPRGAGSGLTGGANAVDGCVVLDVSPMDRILELDEVNQLAVVEPGVLNADLTAAVRERGLDYPPDPASADISSIGGNVATNAGGLCCVKYGVTRNYVLGLETVLADGRRMGTGQRTRKGVAGYDLVQLLTGSEGTLGVFTEVTVRLRPAPPPPATCVAVFASLDAAGEAVSTISRTRLEPSLLELLDQPTLAAIEAWQPIGLDPDAAAVLIGQSDAAGATAADDAEAMAAVCRDAGARWADATPDPAEGEALLTARRLAYPALEARGTPLLDDVCVPVDALPALIAAVQRIATDHDVLIGTFGHAGDGNLHPTLVFDRHDPAARDAAHGAFTAVLRAARDLGGTIAGEHGIGTLKQAHLGALELDPVAHELQRAVKHAFDPHGHLNPGKAL